jgi:hypothetical protein
MLFISVQVFFRKNKKKLYLCPKKRAYRRQLRKYYEDTVIPYKFDCEYFVVSVMGGRRHVVASFTETTATCRDAGNWFKTTGL